MMRGYTRPIAPGIPLVSISASVVALRFLADPRVIPRAFGAVSAFVAPVSTDRLHHPRNTILRLFPWAHAVPLDEPVIQARPPRVMDIPNSSKSTNSRVTRAGTGDAYPTSGGRLHQEVQVTHVCATRIYQAPGITSSSYIPGTIELSYALSYST